MDLRRFRPPIGGAPFGVAVLALLALSSPVQATLVTFDFTTEPRPKQSSGLTVVQPRDSSTGEFGRQISITTFLSSGGTTTYNLGTFGSGPFIPETLWSQRGLFFLGDNGRVPTQWRVS